jgi:hypothetical protein
MQIGGRLCFFLDNASDNNYQTVQMLSDLTELPLKPSSNVCETLLVKAINSPLSTRVMRELLRSHQPNG